MVRRHTHEDSWSGCSLTSDSTQTQSLASIQSSRYWNEFFNGRRTVDPTFKEREVTPRTRSVSEQRREEQIGFRTRSVVRDGKVMRSNRSSEGNILETRGNFGLYQNRDTPPRKGKGTPVGSDRLSVSQISTLPGRHRVSLPLGTGKKTSCKTISQLTTLPGGSNTPQIPDTSPYNPGKRFKRNTNTTPEVEFEVGPPERKKGPIQTPVPARKDLKTYNLVGREVHEQRHSRGSLQVKSKESVEEVRFQKCLKSKPAVLKDLFAPSFRLF